MTAALVDALVAADADYTRFNALRSTDPRASELEERPGRTVVFRDAGRGDSAYYNRVVWGRHTRVGELPELLAWQVDKGAPAAVEIPKPLLSPSIERALKREGLAHVESASVYHCLPETRVVEHVVRRATDAAAIVLFFEDGPASEALRQRYRHHHLDPRFPAFVIEEASVPVAQATVFLSRGIAWLGNANTVEAARGRGYQRALVEHRISWAQAAGCEHVICDVEAGTTSQRNAVRAGMDLAFEVLRYSTASAWL